MTKDRKTRDIQVCCESLHDAVQARDGGARRIELCAALELGGLTPSCGLIDAVRRECPELEINVLIRPRPGNFVYSEKDIEQMLFDIKQCRKMGVHGVVVGALTRDGDINTCVCRRLMNLAKYECSYPTLSVTFHRAFDVCRDPQQALEEIIGLRCDCLLTSGQRATALEGAENIAEYVRQARGRIEVMPGCGITPDNIADIEAITGATIFHASARGVASTNQVYTNPHVDFGENRPVRHTSATLVQQLINI